MRESPSLLHNMSSKPRTSVRCVIAPLGAVAAVFAPDVAAPLIACTDPVDLGLAADRRWKALGMTGAAIVFPEESLEDAKPGPRRVRVRDPWLVLNVLARSRGALLMADAPALVGALAGARTVATCDPRFVALALSGCRETTDTCGHAGW